MDNGEVERLGFEDQTDVRSDADVDHVCDSEPEAGQKDGGVEEHDYWTSEDEEK